ncbi:MAG: phosphatidate cytidylyltransferase [Bacteroidota bacterium]
MLNIVYLTLAFLLLFASAEWLYHKRNIKAEVTRKYVHIATGLLTLFFPLMLENHWFVLLLCESFMLILVASLRLNLLPSINAVDRKTSGSLMYPIIVYGCYLVYSYYDQFMFYYIPILILALCDPIAAFVGMNYPKGKYQTFGKTKTWSGSLCFFGVAVVICLLLMIGVENMTFTAALPIAITVGAATATAEALTHGGYDNFTIPASALTVLILFENYL